MCLFLFIDDLGNVCLCALGHSDCFSLLFDCAAN